MALVLVLGFLVILSGLTIAFFASVTTLSSSSRTYAAGLTTNMLADTAVQMVMGQIREATTPVSILSRPCWVSQPGMIRVFGTPRDGATFPGEVTASQTPYAYFKLYSSDTMILSDLDQMKAYNLKPDDEYSGANGLPPFALPSGVNPAGRAIYADLNAPILTPDPQGTILVNGSVTKYRAQYPIIDPTAEGYVEGFTLKNNASTPPGYSGGALPPAAAYNPGGAPNPAPMPVKWLYILRDGTVMAPSSIDARGVAKFKPVVIAGGSNGGAGSSKVPEVANPIVGRVGFWTDDETCKVNINTASEPTFWDTPLAASIPESYIAPTGSTPGGLGLYQPFTNEFQRYPGHPFTVALSPILGRAFNFIPSTTSYISNPIPNTVKARIYGMAPRVMDSGSKEGSVPIPDSSSPFPPAATVDSDRLYASVDELAFAVSGTGFPATNPRPAADSAITNTVLQRAKFFLTAYNRAPELNLFGQPRVSIWPVWNKEDSSVSHTLTVKDKAFVFCSTIGAAVTSSGAPTPIGGGRYPFYFTRQNPKSPTDDFSKEQPEQSDLYTYLTYLTGGDASGTKAGPIPGFGGNTFLTKYPSPTGRPAFRSGSNPHGNLRLHSLPQYLGFEQLYGRHGGRSVHAVQQ